MPPPIDDPTPLSPAIARALWIAFTVLLLSLLLASFAGRWGMLAVLLVPYTVVSYFGRGVVFGDETKTHGVWLTTKRDVRIGEMAVGGLLLAACSSFIGLGYSFERNATAKDSAQEDALVEHENAANLPAGKSAATPPSSAYNDKGGVSDLVVAVRKRPFNTGDAALDEQLNASSRKQADEFEKQRIEREQFFEKMTKRKRN